MSTTRKLQSVVKSYLADTEIQHLRYRRWRCELFMAMSAGDASFSTASAFPRILAVEASPDMRGILENGLGNLG